MSPLTLTMLRMLQEGPTGAPQVAAAVETWRQAGAPDVPLRPGPIKTLGALLQRGRDGQGWSQRQAATAIKAVLGPVGQTQISRWEAGDALPDSAELAALADLYEFDAQQRALALDLAKTWRHAQVFGRRAS